jgi:hypothetical protein
MKRQPVKLKYLKDIEGLKHKYKYMMETKNIPSIDTSDINVYQDEFRNIFPHLIIDKKFKLNNENSLNLNEILKYLAISLNFKFNDKEISKEDIQSFHEKLQWGNQEHKTEFQHYSLKSRLLSIIISFSNSEEQIFITLYCLYRKVPCFLGYTVYDEFKYNVTNKIYSWSKDISYISLYKGLFLPKHRKKAKLAYEKHIEDIDKLLSKDKSQFIQNYISKTKTRNGD